MRNTNKNQNTDTDTVGQGAVGHDFYWNAANWIDCDEDTGHRDDSDTGDGNGEWEC